MSVSSIVEELQESGHASFGQVGKRSYERIWKIKVSSRDDRGITIFSSTIVTGTAGTLGGYYNVAGTEYDTGAILVERDLRRISDDGLLWQMTDSYDTVAQNTSDSLVTDPLDRSTKLDFEILKFEEAADKDRDDVAITNSAGGAFDPPLVKQVPVVALHFRRNVTSYDIDLALQYVETVNASEWYGVPAGQAKCEEISWSELRYENGVEYREERVTILVRNKSWQPQVLDIGMYYRITNPVSGAVNAGTILDQNGVPLNAPYKLDGSGNVLPDGAADKFLPFNVLEERDFGALNL